MKGRIQLVDFIRGLVLLGVIIVNAISINGPYYMDTVDFAFKLSYSDEIFSYLIEAVFLEKFYPIFVLLFGFSNQLLLNSLADKFNTNIDSLKIASIYYKRMLVLFAIGCLHFSLFFWGDVLVVYAIIGSLLYILANILFKNKTFGLIKLNLILILLSIIINFTNDILLEYDVLHTDFDEHYTEIVSDPTHNDILLDETFSTMIIYNLIANYKLFYYGIFDNFDLIIFLDNLNYFIEILILMIFGVVIARTVKYHHYLLNINKSKLLQIFFIFSFAQFLLFLLNLYIVVELYQFDILFKLFNAAYYLVIFVISYRFMIKKDYCIHIINKISAIGKMTLTWYLLLSVIMSLILNNYGLDLYGRVGVTGCSVIAISYYFLCYTLSSVWLARFKQGPVEKLWRKLTVPSISSVSTSSKRDVVTSAQS